MNDQATPEFDYKDGIFEKLSNFKIILIFQEMIDEKITAQQEAIDNEVNFRSYVNSC